MLDQIDIALLQEAQKKNGQQLAALIQPLLSQRKERTLYDRLAVLESKALIAVDRTTYKNKVLASITEKGLDALRSAKIEITGRENAPQREVASS